MSYKENQLVGVGTNNMVVKPEPQDVRLPAQPLAPSLTAQLKTEPVASTGIKAEQDEVRNVFMRHGLNMPPYLQNNQQPRVEPPAVPPQPSLPIYKKYTKASDIEYSPEGAFKEGLGMVQTLEQGIKKLQLGSKMRSDVWMRELDSLKSQTSPTTLIAVCGATGAGKSSILNAVLDDNVVPTSGMRACTATVTEIAYHDKATIDADVSFLTAKEWEDELTVLLDDLVDEDGNVRRSTDLKSDAGIAWSKVHAVYPTITQERLVTMTPQEIIDQSPAVKAILGTTKTIVAKDSKRFASEIARYIDSKDQSRGKKDKKDKKSKKGDDESDADAGGDVPMTAQEKIMAAARKEAAKEKKKKAKQDKDKKASEDANAPALWPLIRLVNVRCNAKALSTGAILVDLPGVADANAARNNIAKDYMKKCQCIWILAPITRAVDDKTARDLLGDAFKIQLMNGNYDDHTITFIASKCDDISCSEVIRALQLEDDEELEEIEDQITENTTKTKEAKKEKATAERESKVILSNLKDERAIKKEYEDHLKALKNGEKFTPKLTSKNKQLAGKKRKNTRGGKKGKSKRQRGGDDDEDEESDAGSESENDSDDDSDASASDDDSGSDSDSDDHSDSDDDVASKSNESGGEEEEEEEETPDSLKEKISTSKDKIKALRERQTEVKKNKKGLTDQLATFKKQLTGLQKRKNAFCSLKRSEFSKDVLKEDFRTGLKDLDDNAAEERDPDNFDPSINQRDYEKIDLPVFTCSSRDYVRLKKQVEGDGDPTCFTNAEDTGIPALQEWCHQLTLSSRERLNKAFLAHLQTFSVSVRSYVEGIRGVTTEDRNALRAQWETGEMEMPDEESDDEANDDPFMDLLGGRMYTMPIEKPVALKPVNDTGIFPRLTKEFAAVVERCTDDLKKKFQDGLEEKCRVGATNASAAAVETSDAIASSCHWQTYRAMLRRHGAFRRDINEELLGPFTKNIAATWGKLFEDDLFQTFHTAISKAVESLLQDFEISAAPGLKDRVKMQAELCLEEAKVALKKTIDVVGKSMSDEQKEISRCLAPHVQTQLEDGYELAIQETGLGSVKRQKAVFHQYVDDNKDDIFEDGADVIMNRLNEAAESVSKGLCEALGQLAQKIEVNLAILWEPTSDTPAQALARNNVVAEIDSIIQQIDLWRTAEKLKRERDEEERMTRDYLVQDEDVEMD